MANALLDADRDVARAMAKKPGIRCGHGRLAAPAFCPAG
jgi:hypothetical protein